MMRGLLIALGVVVTVWVVAIAALWFFGRKIAAKQLARAIPDLVALCRGLMSDPRVPLGSKLLVGGALVWVLSPDRPRAGVHPAARPARRRDRGRTRAASSHQASRRRGRAGTLARRPTGAPQRRCGWRGCGSRRRRRPEPCGDRTQGRRVNRRSTCSTRCGAQRSRDASARMIASERTRAPRGSVRT